MSEQILGYKFFVTYPSWVHQYVSAQPSKHVVEYAKIKIKQNIQGKFLIMEGFRPHSNYSINPCP